MPPKTEGANAVIVDVNKRTEEILSVAAASPSEVLLDERDEIARRAHSRFSLAAMYQNIVGLAADIYLAPITAIDESIAAAVNAMAQAAVGVLLEMTERANVEDDMRLFADVYARSEAFLETLDIFVQAIANRVVNNTAVVLVSNPEHMAMALGKAPIATRTEEVEVAAPQQAVVMAPLQQQAS